MEAMMRTTIVIDDELLNEAFSVRSAKTKKDLLYEALKEFIRSRKRKDLAVRWDILFTEMQTSR
ncbi:MAG: type II toxin-antitoxin system VapB family antitoxin [Desulfobacterales bacterium]|nr:MAG: type II toxin-antitoxin system VapB family antitoxin [Desulfobacterales bacterium]